MHGPLKGFIFAPARSNAELPGAKRAADYIFHRGRLATILHAAVIAFYAGGLALAQEGVWVTKAPMPVALSSAASGVVNGRLYVAGGWNCPSTDLTYKGTLQYDPGTDAWETRSEMPSFQLGAASAVVNGVLYVIGGYNAGSGLPLATVQTYNPNADAWSTKAPMPTPRAYPVAGVIDGIIYVAGGVGTSGAVSLAIVEAYDPKTNTWTTKAPLPTVRAEAAAGVINGILYVAGGSVAGPGEVFPRTLEAYDPKTNTWSTKTPMPEWTASVGAAVLGGKLYVTNGGVSSGAPLSAWAYDPGTDSWSQVPPMPRPRNLPGVGVVEDVLYVAGGSGYTNGHPQPCLAVNEAFSPFLMVSIDITPGDRTNTINLASKGVVPVAILGSATFDPTTVDPTTVTFAGAHVATRGRREPMTAVVDVNDDGYLDLLLFFRTRDLHLTTASTEAVLYGQTYSGQLIRGSGSVRVIRHRAPDPPRHTPKLPPFK